MREMKRALFAAALLVVGLLAVGLVTTREAAAAEDITCGESTTISVTIRDAAGQPVSDHTRVEFVTNHGGVLAATTASLDPIALASGAVTPLSHTTAETFNGVASAVLLTSTEHAGPYEVLVSSGGSVRATGLPQPPIYLPGALDPVVASYIPRQAYGLVYAPSTAPVTAQVTVTCRVL